MDKSEKRERKRAKVSQEQIDWSRKVASEHVPANVAEKMRPKVFPHIYGFYDDLLNTTNDIFASKIGDTRQEYPETRLNQWRNDGYPNLVKIFFHKAYIDHGGERYYFRDYHVHKILRDWGYVQLYAGNSNNKTFGKIIIPESVTAKQLSLEFYVCEANPKKIIDLGVMKDVYEVLERSVREGNIEYALPTSLDSRSVVKDFSEAPVWDFAPYKYQAKARDTLVKALMKQQGRSKRVLLDAPTRSGKTPTLLWTIKKFLGEVSPGEKSLVVITTAIVDVLLEFKETLQRHSDFRTSFTFVDREKIHAAAAIGEDAVAEAHKEFDVVFTGISLQDLAGRQGDGSLKAVHSGISGRVTLVVGDECHVGMFGSGEVYREAVQESTKQERAEAEAERETLREVFSLKPKYGYIFASATTYNILGSSAFEEDAIHFISQEEVDEQGFNTNAVFMEEFGNDQNSPFFGKPEKFFFGISGTGTDLSIDELFRADKSGNFVHGEAAHTYLDALYGIVESEVVPSLFAEESLKQAGAGQHIFTKMGSKLSCDALEKYYKMRQKTHPEIFGGVKVLNISSTREVGFTAKPFHEIKEFLAQNRFGKSVTITVNRGSTGVSVPEWDTVLLLCGGKSLTRRVQSYGRSTTPWVETVDYGGEGGKDRLCMKPNSFVIDGDAGRLYEIANDVEIHSGALGGGSGDSDEPAIGNIIGFDGVVAKSLSRVDIHRQLDAYIKDKRVGQIVDDMPFDEGADEVLAGDSFADLFEGFDSYPAGKRSAHVALTEEQGEVFARAFAEINDVRDDSDSGEDAAPEGLFPAPEGEVVSPDGEGDVGADSAAEDEAAKKIEESLVEKRRALQRLVRERILLFALLQGEVTSLRAIAEICEDYKGGVAGAVDGRILRRVGLAPFGDLVKLFEKNHALSDGMERGIKALHAKCLGEDGEFDVLGFLHVAQGLSRLSPNEVFTPQGVASLLVDKLDLGGEDFRSFAEGVGVIDVGCKSGVTLLEFAGRAEAAGVSRGVIGERLWAVPTSPLAFEFVHCVFANSGWNTEHVLFCDGLDSLSTVELVAAAVGAAEGEDAEVFPAKVGEILDRIAMKKELCGSVIEFWKRLLGMVAKFDYCISNPPYQLESGRHENGRVNFSKIYDRFQYVSFAIAKNTSMIYPSSWLKSVPSSFSTALIKNGLKTVDEYNGTVLFGNSIRKDYPVCVVVCIESYKKQVLVNGIKNSRDEEEWIQSSSELLLSSLFKEWPVINGGAVHISKIANAQDSGIKNDLDGDCVIYVKQKPGSQADSKEIRVKEKTLLQFLNDPKDLESFTVAVRGRFFKQAQNFAEVKNNPKANFAIKVFEPNYVFGKTLLKIASFVDKESAYNYAAYLNTRLITMFLLKYNSANKFGSAVPDLGDYSNNNPIFKKDEELGENHEYYGLPLEERLYKLFNLTEDEIKIIKG